MKFFLIGIKGSGMASLFNMLKDDGYEVQGSDVESYVYTQDEILKRISKIYSLGDKEYLNNYFVIIGHDFIDAYLINTLKHNNVPYLEYHKFLNFYLDSKKLICISGSHGKTTMTSLLAHSGDYSYLIGNGNGKMTNKSPFFFLEACEYKNHYHIYNPSFIIVTNIDYDHVDYFKTKDEYILSFKKYLDKTNNGLIEYESSKLINNPYYFTFGLNEKADFYAKNYHISLNGIAGTLYFQKEKIIDFEFNNIFGYPLLMDVIALLSFHYLNHNDLKKVIDRIKKYKMTNKRFNILNINNLNIIEDYAHHPTQIKTNYETLKTIYPNKKIIAIFKPDRVSRIKYFYKKYTEVLSLFDKAYLLSFDKKDNNKILTKITNEKITYLDDKLDIIELNKENVYIIMSSKNIEQIKTYIIKNLTQIN